MPKEKEAELQMLDSNARFVAEQLDSIDASLMEINYVKECLNELNSTKKGSEILAPISSGIFVKTKLEDSTKFFVNVGKGVVVEKTVPETIKLLDEKLKEISEARENLMDELKKIDGRLIELGEE
jgi:prefoldin alpha subunit